MKIVLLLWVHDPTVCGSTTLHAGTVPCVYFIEYRKGMVPQDFAPATNFSHNLLNKKKFCLVFAWKKLNLNSHSQFSDSTTPAFLLSQIQILSRYVVRTVPTFLARYCTIHRWVPNISVSEPCLERLVVLHRIVYCRTWNSSFQI
jgi:hypothetical protein